MQSPLLKVLLRRTRAMAMSDSTLVSYLTWIGQSKSSVNESDFLPLYRRLSVDNQEELEALQEKPFEEVFPYLHPIKMEAIVGMINFLRVCRENKPAFVDILLWALKSLPRWNTTRHVNKERISGELTLAVIRASSLDSSQKAVRKRVSEILSMFCQNIVQESVDLELCGHAISGMLQGIREAFPTMSNEESDLFINPTFELLKSGIFDLEEFLKDIPHGSRVDEILLRHYFVLKSILLFLSEALKLASAMNIMNNDLLIEMRNLFLAYYGAIVEFMLYSLADEPFLIECAHHISSIICSLVGMKTAEEEEEHDRLVEFVISLLNSSMAHGDLNGLEDILDPTCLMLFKFSKSNAKYHHDCLKILKRLLIVLSQRQGSNKSAAIVGGFIGDFLSLMLEADNNVFCEAFVTNLSAEIPLDGAEAEVSCIANALGSLALRSHNEMITKICLSALTAHSKKSNRIDPSIFFEQFNLIASSGSVNDMNSVLDMYVAQYMESDSTKQFADLSKAMKALAILNRADTLKSELMLHAVIRLFVDKGLIIVKGHTEKSSKKTTPLNPPIELELLLPVIESLLSENVIDGFINKAAKLEAFQELWFLLIYTGYQQSLTWPETWIPYIPAIALATPVLIKEKDRLKPVSTPLSQVLLSQSANSQLKSQLMNLMPNCGYLTKNLTTPKCLWLMSVFFSETYKVRNGNIADLMTYLSSDLLRLFELDSFVEDLMMTVFKRWLPDASGHNQQILDKFACELVGYCCHPQERIHGFAMRFIKMILDNHKQTYSCHKLWEALLSKIILQYEVCRRALGETVSSEFVVNELELYGLRQEYGRASFEGIVLLARQIFTAASVEYPHDFFAFIETSLHRKQVFFEGRPGDRDVRMLELLRLCLPLSTDVVTNYLNLPLEFQSKPEDYVKWLLCRSSMTKEPRTSASSKPQEIGDLLTETTQKFLSQSVPFKQLYYLDKIVSFPFKVGTANAFKEAVYCWAWLLDERPDLLTTFLGCIHEAWLSHVKNEVGPFGKREVSSVFCGKMKTAASEITHLTPQSSPSIPYIILIDFLQERILLAREHMGLASKAFYMIIVSLCKSMSQITDQLRMRAAVLKTAILAFTFLSQFYLVVPSRRICTIRSHLYSMIISLLEKLPRIAQEDRDFLRYEEGLLLKLRNYFSDEKTAMAMVAKSKKDSASMLPNIDSLSEAAEIIRLLLAHDHEKLMVWSNRFKGRQYYYESSSIQDYIRCALKISPALAVQYIERFHYVEVNQNLLSMFSRSETILNNIDAINFYFKNDLPIDPKQLILAPPLFISSAIGIFRSGKLASRPICVNYSMRSMESIKPEYLFFYIPHIVQALRHDNFGYIERTIMHIARTSSLFAHQIIWNMKANTYQDDLGTVPDPQKAIFDEMIEKVTRLLAGIDKEFFEREFQFFDKVTAISGTLKPYVKKEKWEKKQKIDEELAKIAVDPGVYLPSNPESIVLDIDYQSGRPLQSAAKAPFMATFKVRPKDEPNAMPTWQSVIFKVGDDCRQDVLALQLITAMKNIFESIGLNLYFFPYRVIATGPGCGVIEVIPNAISRSQLGLEKINSLYEYFTFKFGSEKSPKFAQARENLIKSAAAYSLACYLLAIKDRHNANIMISDAGHLIHIDFGFILDISPGGLGLEAPFKLTTEMLSVMGGRDDSPYFRWFCDLCIQGFLAVRQHADHLIQLVECMADSGLPCFRGESTIRKFRNRFRLDLNEADARQYFYDDVIYKSCETIRTALYDKFQERSNGIPY